MKPPILALSSIVFLFPLLVFGQQYPPEQEEVVKITSELVQFDVVVNDKDGNIVTDLQAADFEILQDGKAQKITNFSYVSTAAASTAAATRKAEKIDAIPPTPSRPGKVGRVLTFIVDDGNCAASLTGMRASREALEKFVNEQMLPDDFVAIYQTRSGSSMLQQYTSGKTQLLRAARKIRWYPQIGTCASENGSLYAAARPNSTSIPTITGLKTITNETESERKKREAIEDFSRNNQVVGTLGVIRYIIRGLERIPGRKVVFLLSDGMPIRGRSGETLSAADVLRDLTDLANRSSVVFNTIDNRGLFDSSMIEARDEVPTLEDADATSKIVGDRRRDIFSAQDGLSFLAHETGGSFQQGQSYLDVPIARALSREKGYYLLAYEPESDTFKGKNFNKIDIRLKRPDLKVRSRAGFLGVTTESIKPKKLTGDSELYEAIVAPLPQAGMNLRLTAFFGNSASAGNFVRSLVHLDGKDISFADDASGMKKVSFDVIAVTMNEKNEVVDEFNRTHTLKFDAAAVPMISRHGLIYSTDVPVKKAGIYSFRVAVRDTNSRLLGSASQMVQVADTKDRKLILSGLSVAEADEKGKFAIPTSVSVENALDVTRSDAIPAVRRIRRGTILGYSYTIYNARLDKATNQPKLSIQVNLFRNGQLISEGSSAPAQLENQPDWSRINDYGYMRINPGIETGDYALQVIVKDLLTDGNNATSSQWIDFEVIE